MKVPEIDSSTPRRLSCHKTQRKHRREMPAGKADAETKPLTEEYTPLDLTVQTDNSITTDSVKKRVAPSSKIVACKVTTPSPTTETETHVCAALDNPAK